MTRFAYVARDNAGHSVTGTLTAANPTAASRQLRQEGKFLVRLEPSGDQAALAGPAARVAARPSMPGNGSTAGKSNAAERQAKSQPARPAAAGVKPAGQPAGVRGAGSAGSPGNSAAVRTAAVSGKIRKTDVVYLTTQLAVMTDTGVPVSDALDSIVGQTANAGLKQVLTDVSERVKSGEEFSAALANHPKVFPPMYVAMVKAAEASGTLGVMLERVAGYLVDENETRKKIKGALTYPCVMMVFALAVTVFLMAFVMPKFTAIYANRDAALPLATRILMGISNGLVDHWIILLAAAGGAVAAAVAYLRSVNGQAWWAEVKLRIPLFGAMLHKLYLTRCLRTLGTLIGTGVDMLDAVQITRQVIGVGPYARLWSEVDDAIRQGQQLSEPLFRSRLIPRSIVQMIAAGERTGKVAEVMERVATFCDRELKDQIKTSTAMIEPIMIAGMGLIIGTVVLALLLPIFSISQVMAGPMAGPNGGK